MLTNVMVKTCLNQVRMIHAMKGMSKRLSKAEFFRKPFVSKISECSEVQFTRHDNREAWSDNYSIFPKAEFVRILPNVPKFPKCGLNTFFVYLMMTNVMVKTCLNQKIIRKYVLTLGNSSKVVQAAGDIISAGITIHRALGMIFSEWQMLWWKHVLTRKI